MPTPLQSTTKVTELSYTALPDFLKRIEGSQGSPACLSGNGDRGVSGIILTE